MLENSQVRHLNGAFCGRNRKCTMRMFFARRGIDRVAERLDTCLGDEGTKHFVNLNAGGNDYGIVRSEKL